MDINHALNVMYIFKNHKDVMICFVCSVILFLIGELYKLRIKLIIQNMKKSMEIGLLMLYLISKYIFNNFIS